jgi:hypothetical protein
MLATRAAPSLLAHRGTPPSFMGYVCHRRSSLGCDTVARPPQERYRRLRACLGSVTTSRLPRGLGVIAARRLPSTLGSHRHRDSRSRNRRRNAYESESRRRVFSGNRRCRRIWVDVVARLSGCGVKK